MREGREEGVCVRREIDAGGGGFEIQDGTDEGGVLMGEAIVFLPGPGACLDVVDAANILAPRGLPCL